MRGAGRRIEHNRTWEEEEEENDLFSAKRPMYKEWFQIIGRDMPL